MSEGVPWSLSLPRGLLFFPHFPKKNTPNKKKQRHTIRDLTTGRIYLIEGGDLPDDDEEDEDEEGKEEGAKGGAPSSSSPTTATAAAATTAAAAAPTAAAAASKKLPRSRSPRVTEVGFGGRTDLSLDEFDRVLGLHAAFDLDRGGLGVLLPPALQQQQQQQRAGGGGGAFGLAGALGHRRRGSTDQGQQQSASAAAAAAASAAASAAATLPAGRPSPLAVPPAGAAAGQQQQQSPLSAAGAWMRRQLGRMKHPAAGSGSSSPGPSPRRRPPWRRNERANGGAATDDSEHRDDADDAASTTSSSSGGSSAHGRAGRGGGVASPLGRLSASSLLREGRENRESSASAVRTQAHRKAHLDFPGLSLVQSLPAHSGAVWAAAFSPDGGFLATAGQDALVRVWSVNRGRASEEGAGGGTAVAEEGQGGGAAAAAAAATGAAASDAEAAAAAAAAATASADAEGRDDEAASASASASREKTASSEAEASAPASGVLSDGGGSTASRRQQRRREKELPDPASSSAPPLLLDPAPHRSYRGHRADVLDVAWSGSGFLLSASMDKSVRLWHVSLAAGSLRVFRHADFVTSLAFCPADDRFFASGSIDGERGGLGSFLESLFFQRERGGWRERESCSREREKNSHFFLSPPPDYPPSTQPLPRPRPPLAHPGRLRRRRGRRPRDGHRVLVLPRRIPRRRGHDARPRPAVQRRVAFRRLFALLLRSSRRCSLPRAGAGGLHRRQEPPRRGLAREEGDGRSVGALARERLRGGVCRGNGPRRRERYRAARVSVLLFSRRCWWCC